MSDDFLDELCGPLSDDIEGEPRERSRIPCLVVGPKKGENELEACGALLAELYRAGLLRVAFEQANEETGEITTMGEITEAELLKIEAIHEKHAAAIEAGYQKDLESKRARVVPMA